MCSCHPSPPLPTPQIVTKTSGNIVIKQIYPTASITRASPHCIQQQEGNPPPHPSLTLCQSVIQLNSTDTHDSTIYILNTVVPTLWHATPIVELDKCRGISGIRMNIRICQSMFSYFFNNT